VAAAVGLLQLLEQRKSKGSKFPDLADSTPATPRPRALPAAERPSADSHEMRAAISDRRVLTPRVWNLPGPNRGFTGRDDLLEVLHERLHSSGEVMVLVLRGMGGVGKSQLVLQQRAVIFDPAGVMRLAGGCLAASPA
jgi:hypothetical protein